jgi:hypothetical protein
VSIYGFLEHNLHIPWVFQATVLAVMVLFGSGLVMRRQLAAAGGGQIPDEGVTLRNVMEVIVEGLANMGASTSRWSSPSLPSSWCRT